MSASPEHLQRLIVNRDLISFRRKRVDGHSIQAFPLAVSQRLLLCQQVYDFHIDGFLLVRLKDISDCKVGDTNVFQRRLLDEEGALGQVQFEFRAPIDSFLDFLSSIDPSELVIVESERTDPVEMLIGTVASVQPKSVSINYITGIARQLDTPSDMLVRDITCCQLRTNYILHYQRHFERQKPRKRCPQEQ